MSDDIEDEEAPAPWLRYDDEPSKAHYFFTKYRDLGPQRSIVKAIATALPPEKHTKTTARTWNGWSSRWQWVARCEAFDRWRDEEDLRARAAARAKELLDFDDRLAAQSRVFSQFVQGLQKILLASMMKRLSEPDDLTTPEIARCLKAVAVVQQTANECEAAALGLPELLCTLYGVEERPR